MELTRLQELKQRLLHDTQLPPIWSFFLDHLGENSEFIALGQRLEHAFLSAVVAQVARTAFPEPRVATDLLLARIPGQAFIHGGFFLAGRPGGLLYFEDIEVGLLVATDLPPSIEVKYARFSTQPLRKAGPSQPSRN